MALEGYTDQQIVTAILNRDTFVTREFLYKKCYPLFKSIYNRYYTDCENWIELVNEIYILLLIPSKKTGESRLAQFKFDCTITNWLKIITENYCHQIYAKKLDIIDKNFSDGDILWHIEQSLELDIHSINVADIKKVIEKMPNKRYQKLIEYRYLDEMSNEETAARMSMTMPNYYNKHKLAKAQFIIALRKEGIL
jgi:RNA polymerase sigma factor (sigma-70 family)